jgi:hypothetical protein
LAVALRYLIGHIAKTAQRLERTGGDQFNSRGDRFDFEAFKCAVEQLLDLLAPPPGDVGSSSYKLLRTGEGPDYLGRILATGAFALLTTSDDLHAIAERKLQQVISSTHSLRPRAKEKRPNL